ncbi:hypothetical protein MT962_004105 [Franconibacter sp. IITDAS19]|uniref:Vgb family protein n=1 Tax=Franconibacter sp. IITDAS19 TaxID=2930569 RepID=UPI001FF8D709|nr:hypothetical protein [Franconibacter sp. IITDAS19]MCK1970215.1 hypothetical protein [Franconibacter sp. IITDAS19]
MSISIKTTIYDCSEGSDGFGIQDSGMGYIYGTFPVFNGGEEGAIYQLNVATSTTRAITSGFTPQGELGKMTLGNDQMIYFSERNINYHIGKIAPTSGSISEIPIPGTVTSRMLGGITTDKTTGLIWLTSRVYDIKTDPENVRQGIISYNPATGEISEYLTASFSPDNPGDITVDNAGNIWFVELSGAGLIRFTPNTQEFSYYPAPLNEDININALTTDTDGNIWYTNTYYNNNAGAIGKFTPETGEYTQYSEGILNGPPSDIVIMNNGAIWFNEHSGQYLGTLDPDTGYIEEISVNIPAEQSLFGQGDLCLSQTSSNIIWGCSAYAITSYEIIDQQ